MFAKKQLLRAVALCCALFSYQALKAQFVFNSDSAFKAGSPNSGRIWGYAFGDYYYKAPCRSACSWRSQSIYRNSCGRNAFAFRRIYLGYDYNISKKFSAELLLAAEDNATFTSASGNTSTTGDLLGNNKLSFYIKLANIRWKNIWKKY